MTPDECRKLDATELTTLVRTGELRPQDVLHAAQETTGLWNKDLNFVACMQDPPTDLPASNAVRTMVKDLGSHVPGFSFWNGSRLFDGERSPQYSNFGTMLRALSD